MKCDGARVVTPKACDGILKISTLVERSRKFKIIISVERKISCLCFQNKFEQRTLIHHKKILRLERAKKMRSPSANNVVKN